MTKAFSYYELQIRTRHPLLGTNASVDIMQEHVINKSREQIALANRSTKKISKSLKKYVGPDIGKEKEIEELKGILRAQQELLNVKEEIPDTLEDIMAYSDDLQQRLDNHFEDTELHKSTVFLRDEEGNVGISSHMILGNIKAILSNVINSGNKEFIKSKVQLGEVASMDIKFLEPFLVASKDILRDPLTKERILNIRPIRFVRMGATISAIAASEQLPAGTQFTTTLRVRKESPLNSMEILNFIFDHGKNIGLGAFRNSNCYGSYDYKLTELKNFVEKVEGSAEGWR